MPCAGLLAKRLFAVILLYLSYPQKTDMDYSIHTGAFEKLPCDCLLIGTYQDRQLTPSAHIIDQITQGAISQLLERGDISGKIGESLLVNWLPGQAFARILVVGLGENKTLTHKNFVKILATSAASLLKTPVQSGCLHADRLPGCWAGCAMESPAGCFGVWRQHLPVYPNQN